MSAGQISITVSSRYRNVCSLGSAVFLSAKRPSLSFVSFWPCKPDDHVGINRATIEGCIEKNSMDHDYSTLVFVPMKFVPSEMEGSSSIDATENCDVKHDRGSP